MANTDPTTTDPVGDISVVAMNGDADIRVVLGREEALALARALSETAKLGFAALGITSTRTKTGATVWEVTAGTSAGPSPTVKYASDFDTMGEPSHTSLHQRAECYRRRAQGEHPDSPRYHEGVWTEKSAKA